MLGHVTSAVQFGFIVGTLVFASLTIADRFSPSKVFFLSACFGAVFNAAVVLIQVDAEALILLRFLTGFCLAGIYPVGMKIAADYHEKGLGNALGFLLGALVLGTAFPHLLRAQTSMYTWQFVMLIVSGIAVVGGLAVLLLVPDGPFRQKGTGLDLTAVYKLFRIREFRAAAFGYFGHMWELYAFWAFVPVFLSYGLNLPMEHRMISWLSFTVIAVGTISCIIGGLISRHKGSAKVVFIALLISGSCCILSPFLVEAPAWLFLMFLLIWGMAVIADSPQFSTLVATSASPVLRGSGLTIVNCIGFSITIVSIQLLNLLRGSVGFEYLFLFLVPGPVLGLLAMRKLVGGG
jgi:MFS family permease